MLKKYSKSALTLTELLVAIGIFLIIIVAVNSAYVLNQRAYREGEMAAELTQNGRVVLERITREIRQAKETVTEIPQVPDNPEQPPPSEIEIEDGHTPSPYEELGSDYYYIRYYLPEGSTELKRQYRVYCFDECAVCDIYFRWNDIRIVDSTEENTHPCLLEETTIGEYITNLKFWGSSLINISITLSKNNKEVNLQTKVLGRNL